MTLDELKKTEGFASLLEQVREEVKKEMSVSNLEEEKEAVKAEKEKVEAENKTLKEEKEVWENEKTELEKKLDKYETMEKEAEREKKIAEMLKEKGIEEVSERFMGILKKASEDELEDLIQEKAEDLARIKGQTNVPRAKKVEKEKVKEEDLSYEQKVAMLK